MTASESIHALWERHPVRFAVTLALLVRVVWLVFVIEGSFDVLKPNHFPNVSPDGDGYIYTPVQAVDAWARWDAVYYVSIADMGYRAHDVRDAAFFPLYPLAIRAVSAVTRLPHYVSGLLVGNLCDMLGWALFALLARARFREGDARGGKLALWALVAFALFPTRNFGFSVYTEGLFLASAVGAFLAYERAQYEFAALAAACASATRPPGVLVAAALVLDALASRRPTRLREAAVLGAGALGAAAYMGWLGWRFGDPFRFMAAQAYWHRSFGNPLRVFASGGDPLDYLTLFSALIACGLMLWRPAPVRDRVFSVLSVLVPMTSGSMMSMARFLGVVFPLFLFAASREPSRGLRWTYTTLAALYACCMAYRLGQGDLVI